LCWTTFRGAGHFLKDVTTWLNANQGLSLPPDRLVKTLYLSELTVTTNKTLSSINPKLNELARSLAEKMAATGRANEGYTVGGFSLWANNWHEPAAPPQYRFEIKLGSIPGEHRYYSAAPVTTDDHIALLEQQEKLFP
jgi:hypothetical protein